MVDTSPPCLYARRRPTYPRTMSVWQSDKYRVASNNEMTLIFFFVLIKGNMSSLPTAYATVLWHTFEYQLSDSASFPSMKNEMLTDLKARNVKFYDVDDPFWVKTAPSELDAPVLTLVYDHMSEVNNHAHTVLEEKNYRELKKLCSRECIGNVNAWIRQAANVDIDVLTNHTLVEKAAREVSEFLTSQSGGGALREFDPPTGSGLEANVRGDPDAGFIVNYTYQMFEAHRPAILEMKSQKTSQYATPSVLQAHQAYDEKFNPVVVPKAHLEWYLGMLSGFVKDVSRYGA